MAEVNKERRMSSVRVVVKREGTLKSSTTVGLAGATVVVRKKARIMSSVRVVVKREGILKSSTTVGLSGATVVVRKEEKTMSVVKVEGGWGTLKRTVVSARAGGSGKRPVEERQGHLASTFLKEPNKTEIKTQN